MTQEQQEFVEKLTEEYITAVSEYADTIVVSLAFDTIAGGDNTGVTIRGYGSPIAMLGLVGMSDLHMKKRILNMNER